MNETDIREMLTRYVQAEKDLLEGKNVMFGNKLLQRENLSEIRKGRQEWEIKLDNCLRGGRSGPALATFN